MERIEIPAEVYFIAKNKKKFLNEAECLRYEYLLDKYCNSARHRVCEDGEGHGHNFFYIKKEEISEICEWSWHFLGYRPWFKDGSYQKWTTFTEGWVWLPWEEQYAEGCTPELGTIEEFIELQEECIAGYKHSLTMAEQIKNTPGPRS